MSKALSKIVRKFPVACVAVRICINIENGLTDVQRIWRKLQRRSFFKMRKSEESCIQQDLPQSDSLNFDDTSLRRTGNVQLQNLFNGFYTLK